MPNRRRIHVPLPRRATMAAAAAATLLAGALSLMSTTSIVHAAEHANWHDFNGDGLADLAIGIPNRTVNGHENAGAVIVLYGSGNGLTATGSQLWHEDKAAFAGLDSGRAETGDHFGTALASGDFDDDGFGDLAIGVPGQDDPIASVADSGEIVVLWGSQNGLAGPASSFLDFEPNDHMGSALVALNFFDANSQSTTPDAIADLATVGANSERAFVFAGGSRTFLQDNTNHCLQFVGQGSSQFVMAAGNTDSDAADELYVGQPNEPRGTSASVGLVTRLDRDGEECSSTSIRQSTFDGDDVAGDRFGAALVVANLLGSASGKEQLVVGIPGKEVTFNGGTVNNAGMLAVIAGNVLLPVTEDSPKVPGNPHAGDRFGASLAVGQFDGDTLLDLAIGVPGATVGGKAGAGLVHILRGDPNIADFRFSQATQLFEGTAAPSDGFGTTLSAANFGHGGKSDLAIGSPRDNEAGAADAGLVNVVYGSNDGPRGSNDQAWSLATNGVPGNPAANDHLGAALR